MTAERWMQVKHLFEEALEQPQAGRESFIQARANGDADLVEQALLLLRNSENSGGLLDLTLVGRNWVRPAAVARTLDPGHILAGRYRIVRPIGAGGMGEVYEAEDLDLNARVAVKTMRVSDDATLARFKREIQLARTVTHPNVCRIFDLHRHHEPESGRVITFLTMELVNGETLAEAFRRTGAMNPGEALPIIRQIAAALEAAHEKGVVHRDLKPGNVMLADTAGRVVVTDFGLAYPQAQATEVTVTVAGTPAYMAPEQFEGKPVTAAADIYAFGVLLYEMVVGRRPFQGDSPIAVALEKVRRLAPVASDSAPSLPSAWSAVIERCLAAQPERRFQNIRDALRPLEESVDRQPVLRLTRRQKRMCLAAAGFVVLTALAFWRYTQSTYTPANEAVRLYRLGLHARQLELPWKASQLFERALESDGRFIAARAQLAEAWMELDQPGRARAELERAAAMRPRWQRSAAYETFLEQAAYARLRGDLAGSATLYGKASAAAPADERPGFLVAEASAWARAGDAGRAIGLCESAEADPRSRCAATLLHAVLSEPHPPQAFLRYDRAAQCFESVGDLDGVAQAVYSRGRTQVRLDDYSAPVREHARRAASIARSTGNIEQEIRTAALMTRVMLELGDEEAAYAAFSRGMQIAERNGLNFLSAWLLNDRAQYHFDKGEFMQADSFHQALLSVARAAGMPWTVTRHLLRNARACLRMQTPLRAANDLAQAEDELRKFPNAALSKEVADLVAAAKQTYSRPEESIYRLPERRR